MQVAAMNHCTISLDLCNITAYFPLTKYSLYTQHRSLALTWLILCFDIRNTGFQGNLCLGVFDHELPATHVTTDTRLR